MAANSYAEFEQESGALVAEDTASEKSISEDSTESDEWNVKLNTIQHPAEPLPDNMYGVAIGSLIRDTADHSRHGLIKIFRIVAVIGIFLVMLGVQVFLVIETKKLVTPEQVKIARVNYGKYESHMYSDAAGIEHTYLTKYGYARGISADYFNRANFATLDDDVKSQICELPMSNIPFLFTILWIWGLTVLDHVRDCCVWAVRIMWLKRCSTEDMRVDSGHGAALKPQEDGCFKVKAVPLWLKGVVVVFILLPKLLLSMFILWLGARWLTSTLGFGDVLLNAVALAFIYDLADLVYKSVIPYHTKLLSTQTLIPQYRKRERESCGSMFGLMNVAVASLGLSVLYIYKLQHVLPEYKWDVAEVCVYYLQTELAV